MMPTRRPFKAVSSWVRRQPPKVKAFLAVISGMVALVLLRAIVHDHDNLFVAAEAVHSIGILVLIYKLMKEKTCAGISLKSQELTAIFLAVRLYCSFVMEYDIHTVLDLATLATTLWVIYMIRFKLRSSYMEDKDNLALYYVVFAVASLCSLSFTSTSIDIASLRQQDCLGFLCLPGSCFCATPTSRNAKHQDCGTIYSSLCICTGSCEVSELCSLGSPGFGQSWSLACGIRLWTMAFNGSYLRNCSNIHIGRFLLLLR